MSLYQFAAAIAGWKAAHDTGSSTAAPSADEFEKAKRLHGDG